jgi:hypothetical protein
MRSRRRHPSIIGHSPNEAIKTADDNEIILLRVPELLRAR